MVEPVKLAHHSHPSALRNPLVDQSGDCGTDQRAVVHTWHCLVQAHSPTQEGNNTPCAGHSLF